MKHIIHEDAVLASYQYKELVVVKVDFKMVARNEARIAHIDISRTSSTRTPNSHPCLAHQKLCLVIVDESRQCCSIRCRSCGRSTCRMRMIKCLHRKHFKRIFSCRTHDDRPTEQLSSSQTTQIVFVVVIVAMSTTKMAANRRVYMTTCSRTISRDHKLELELELDG